MSASEVGVGYVRLLPSMRGFSSEVRRGLTPVAAASGRDFGSGFARGFVASSAGIVDSIGRTVMAGVETVGTLAGGVLVASLTGGARRLTALEDATAMLDQMGVNAKDSRVLLDAALQSVLGTPFALDTVTTSMANFVSAGQPLERIPGLLNQVVDAAGFGKAPLEEVALIWQRIGLQGRVSNDELRMLTMRNIPAYSLLATALGTTERGVRELAAEGELSADMFFEAWDVGAKGFGDTQIVMEGAAQAMGDTTRGAFANMLTAASRFGANLLGPVFGDAKTFFEGIGTGFDALGARIGPAMARLTETPGFRRFRQWITDLPDTVGPAIDWVIDKFRELGPAAAPLAAAFGAISLGGLARALGPLGAIIPTISPLVAAFGGLIATSPELRDAFRDLWTAAEPFLIAMGETLVETLIGLAEATIPILVAVIEDVLIPTLDFLAEHADIAAPAILGLAAAMWVLNAALLVNPWTWVVLGILAMAAATIWLVNNWDTYLEYLAWIWGGFVGAIGGAVTAILTELGHFVAAGIRFRDSIVDGFSAMPGAISESIRSVPSVIGDMLRNAREAATQGISEFWFASLALLRGFQLWVAGLPDRIVAALAQLGGKLRMSALAAWAQFRAGAVERFGAMLVWIRGLPVRIVSALARLGPQLLSSSRAAWRELLVGASQRVAEMIGWVRGIPGRIRVALGNVARILYWAGRSIIRGLRDGMVDAWTDVSRWLASRAWEIRNLKGPIAEDRRLLALEGHAIIGGLGDAMRAEFAHLEQWLAGVAPAIEFQLAPAAAAGTTAPMAPATPSRTLQFGDVHLGGREDYDELTARLQAWNATYG